MMMKLAFLISMSLLIAWAGSAGAELAIAFDSQEIWLGNQAAITCISNRTADLWAVVEQPIKSNLFNFAAAGQNTAKLSYKPPVVGDYLLYCADGSEVSEKKGFLVSDLQMVLLKTTTTLFKDEAVEIELRLTKPPSGGAVTDGVRLNVFMDDRPLAAEPPFFFQDRWIIKGSSAGFAPKGYIMTVEAIYQDKKITKSANLTIKPDTEFSVELQSSELSPGQKTRINLRGSYKGFSFIEEAPVRLYIDGAAVGYEKIAGGLEFYSPEKPPGDYGLAVETDFQGNRLREAKTVRYEVPLRGELSGTSEDVSGSVEFSREGTKEIIGIAKQKYQGTVPKGIYDITIRLPDATASFKDAEISSEQINFLRYDKFPFQEMEGLRLAAGLAMEFTLSFKAGEIEIVYDASKISDEPSLVILMCKNWNLDSRTCSGGWQQAKTEIDVVRNIVKVPAARISAVAVGERKGLDIEAKFDREKYYINDVMGILGIVRSDGEFVAGAAVEMASFNTTLNFRTDASGVFSASIPVSPSEGKARFFFRASKSAYKTANITKEVLVERRKEMAVIVPQRVDAFPGKPMNLQISVINTGQAKLNNMKVSISGMPEGSFDYSPKSWDMLAPGEEKKISMDISGLDTEKKAITALVNVRSDELTRDESFVISVKDQQAVAAEPAAAQSETPFTALIALGQPGVTDMALAAVIIFLAAMIIIRRKRRQAEPSPAPLVFSQDILYRRPARRVKRNRGKRVSTSRKR